MGRAALRAAAALTLALIACGGAPGSGSVAYGPNGGTVSAPPTAAGGAPVSAGPATPTGAVSPDPATPAGAPAFARSSVSIQTKSGPVVMAVEIADDERRREYGLMNRSSMPAGAGMLFVFNPPANAKQIGFWMQDTLIPLSIAFVEPDMAIENIQEMQALSQDVHYAPRDYSYAIEANRGFFADHGVSVGDRVSIQR